MDMYYETDRLILRILMENSAKECLDFHWKNKNIFEFYEPDRPANFYTIYFQEALLRHDRQAIANGTGVRFWVFVKDFPNQVIGTVSFQNVIRGAYQSCLIGYKFDKDFWHHGYATEAIAKGISIIFKEWNLHRVEALVLPGNNASIHLLERLGFAQEGICRSCVCLHSNWEDHIRYSYINRSQ